MVLHMARLTVALPAVRRVGSEATQLKPRVVGRCPGCVRARSRGFQSRSLQYSLISVREVELSAGEAIRLLQLRNPWGNAQEWSGAWADTAPEWEANPEVARALGYQPNAADGLFWLSWDDFAEVFTSVEVCAMAMPTKRADFEPTYSHNRHVSSSRSSVRPAPPPRAKPREPPPTQPPASKPGGGAGGEEGPSVKPVAGFAAVPKAARQLPRQAPRARRLPKAGVRIRYPDVAIQPVPQTPQTPFAQYLVAHERYILACRAQQAAQLKPIPES